MPRADSPLRGLPPHRADGDMRIGVTLAEPAPGRRARWRSALRLSVADVLAIGLAWLLLGIASGTIGRVPFRRLAPVLGRSTGSLPLTPLVTPAELARARFIARAIARAARFAPFRADCLPQALATAVLCRWLHVPAATLLGVKPGMAEGPDSPSAHAWTVAGPLALCGGGGALRHGVVACFVVGAAFTSLETSGTDPSA